MTGLVTKKYGFMPRVTILCHSKEELGLYIYIYIYDMHAKKSFLLFHVSLLTLREVVFNEVSHVVLFSLICNVSYHYKSF
jgi:hypothetical protein